jgi:hypothetical protein
MVALYCSGGSVQDGPNEFLYAAKNVAPLLAKEVHARISRSEEICFALCE